MDRIESLLQEAETACASVWEKLAATERACFTRILDCLQAERVAPQHFAGTSGYGYGDIGRETLERVYARALGCERALVRPHIVSGTHALAIALFGLLRPDERLLSAVGRPYDTLEAVIGIDRPGDGSLASWGVGYSEVALTADNAPDFVAIQAALSAQPDIRVVLVQRSRGYAWRPSLSLEAIGEICRIVHATRPEAIVVVDNCYGEFTEAQEPAVVGADVLVGSLIKNPGGGLAATGGYLAGRSGPIARIADRLTSPGIGAEVGSYAAGYLSFYQGLFLAPHTVVQALQTASLAARAFASAGFDVSPAYDAPRHDIIQAIRLGTPERVIAFCRAIQAASPVDSFAVPEPWAMPGYQHPVIMAAGTFVSGASIELSADAPIRPPYIVYLQGGLTYEHGRLAVGKALASVLGEA